MKTRLVLELTDSRSALPRLVAVLHARGLAIERAHVEGSECSLTVEGQASPERIVAALDRCVDVRSVTLAEQPDPIAQTRYVATRLSCAHVATTPHPWFSYA